LFRVALAAVLLAALTGCQVQTRIAVTETGANRGVVQVTVSLDRAALAAVGGSAALAAQLQEADLVAAGWAVTGPAPGPGSSTVVSASHPYTSLPQASALVAELAGGGSPGGRPFRLALAHRRTFWHTDTRLTGTVDLTCGVACFGDSGLASALGFPTGVDPRAMAAATGQRPEQVFLFSLDARLRGSTLDSNAVVLPDGSLRWTPRLGQRLQLAAVTRTWNRGHVVGVSVAAGVAGVLLLSGAGYWWWRRRRARRSRRARASLREAVSPPS
jgi:hypothetical protein